MKNIFLCASLLLALASCRTVSARNDGSDIQSSAPAQVGSCSPFSNVVASCRYDGERTDVSLTSLQVRLTPKEICVEGTYSGSPKSDDEYGIQLWTRGVFPYTLKNNIFTVFGDEAKKEQAVLYMMPRGVLAKDTFPINTIVMNNVKKTVTLSLDKDIVFLAENCTF